MKTLISQTFISDGGHGWLKVSKDRLSKLNLLDKISSFSYMRGNFVYLEEDTDLSLYVDALLKIEKVERGTEDYLIFMRRFWHLIKSSETRNSSRVRHYERFKNLSKEAFQEIEDLRIKIIDLKNWSSKAIRDINKAPTHTVLFWKEYYNL